MNTSCAIVVCLSVFCAHTHRINKNVSQGLSAKDTHFANSNGDHQVPEDDHTYSTVNDMQQQMIVASNNPAYGKRFEHSRWPGQQHNDHDHSAIELSQERKTEAYGPQAHGAIQLKKKAIASVK